MELAGGGTRIPAVQEAVTQALLESAAGAAVGGLEDRRFGAKLDDASLAVGAALVAKRAVDAAGPAAGAGATTAGEAGAAAAAGEAEAADAAHGSALGAEALAVCVAAEAEMAGRDAAAAARSAAVNELEGYILEARGMRSRKHGSLIDGASLEPMLDEAEDWLYSDAGEAAGCGELGAFLAALRVRVDGTMVAFREKVEAERVASEAALQASADAAAAERAANGEDEDHDQRRLKYPDRLRMVQKNKDEGTELFKGAVDVTQYRQAAARYNKALTHAAKFVDLSPDQREEVDALKLSLHLNIAMCWLKITDATNHLDQASSPSQKPCIALCRPPSLSTAQPRPRLDQAIRSCTDALALDGENVKALYRRATALEQKKDYEAAKADLAAAAKIAPDDKAVPKLQQRVEAQIKRQLDKEKKMYGKMFG